jgi:phage-related protein
MYDVEFYKNRSDEEPIKNLLIELQKQGKTDKNARIRSQKILAYIRALQEYGTRAGLPYMKPLADGIWELRPTNERILFFFFKDNTFILLHHFYKKTQKTPPREIKQAKRNMKDHIERSK